MSYQESVGGLRPPPLHYSRSTSDISPPSGSSSAGPRVPPPLPPRPNRVVVSSPEGDNCSTADSGEEDVVAPNASEEFRASSSTVNLLSTKDEEELSEVQLRELYDDEEIERFLHLFSTYVREVRATDSTAPSSIAQAASASAPALSDTLATKSTTPTRPSLLSVPPKSLSERFAFELFLPLLPPPRPPPPEFSLGRLKQTAQRLYVALEPIYSVLLMPLLRLATWQDTRRSFVYCALYWVLWYHGLLFSALILLLLYRLIRRKVYPYPSLAELRAYRSRIDRSQTFGTTLSARLAASPSIGVRDMWDLFKDYRRARKLKKGKSHKHGGSVSEDKTEASDTASVHSVATERPEENHEGPAEEVDVKEEDLKRLGLFMLNEVADLLERVKNIFLWRNPSASVFYGAVLFGWCILGLLPATYLVRFVGFLAGAFFWHVIPVLAVLPPSERSRIPPPLSSVPTDAEYAMDLISQRVARGLPVRPKRRKAQRRHSPSLGVAHTAAESEHDDDERSTSSSVNWNKWGDRLAFTKDRTGDLRNVFRDGQWKKSDGWKEFITPLAAKVVAPDSGPETRVEAHTFPAQFKQHPGLITLTPTTVFFTPLLSSRATLCIPLQDVTGVKKSSMKGIDINYSEPFVDGSKELKEAKFMFVGSRDDLFARLVSYGGKRWKNV
ncbi:hypothetical protein FKP32DRAFT_1652201 [Trametes sanguinea]|nr:hypothetical protein FKP32DRAFT_1652201 [Trametes sanguinea]